MKKPTIYIPYHQKLDELCDFVFQTANILLGRGYSVTLILYDYAYLFGDVYNRKFFSRAYQQLLQHPRFNIIRPIARIHPRKGLRRLYQANNILFQKQIVRRVMQSMGILWVFWPEDTELVQRVKRESQTTMCLYDCVDYFTSIDRDLDRIIQKQEASLMRSCDHVFVNSHTLYEIKRKLRQDVHRVPLGFDYKSFKQAKRMISPNIESLFAHMPKPIIGYCGYLTFRFDYALLMKLIPGISNASFVFFGPTKIFPHEFMEKETIRLIERLKLLPNVYMIPPISSKEETARAVSHFDVGIIPYNISHAYNRYCFPMKLMEYFYFGIPVVSTPIAEFKRFPQYVALGTSTTEWGKSIKEFLSKPRSVGVQKGQARVAIANSWEKKISRILTFIH